MQSDKVKRGTVGDAALALSELTALRETLEKRLNRLRNEGGDFDELRLLEYAVARLDGVINIACKMVPPH